MSTSVFKPFFISEMMERLRPRWSGYDSQSDVTVNQPERQIIDRVRRNLFGPIDHEESRAFVERELAAQQIRDAERWDFDFLKETPIINVSKTRRYIWEKVNPSGHVPKSYALRRFSYLGEADATTTKKSETSTDQNDVTETSEKASASSNAKHKQTHITDYMRRKKRSCDSKLSSVSAISEPPCKIRAKAGSS